VFRLGRELGRIEVVAQALELAPTRLRDGEEPRDRPLRQPAELRTRCQYLADRTAVAAEGDKLDPAAPGLEHADGDLGPFLDQPALAPRGAVGSGWRMSRLSCDGP